MSHGAEDTYLKAVAHLEEDAIDVDAALESFWAEETEKAAAAAARGDARATNDLPLARIKRIMKSDEDVRMIAAEAPVLFAKACELFITELTIRSYSFAAPDATSAAGARRRTLTREDVAAAVQKTDVFDFLVGVLTPGARPQYMIDAEAGVVAGGARAGGGGGGGGGGSGTRSGGAGFAAGGGGGGKAPRGRR